MIQLRQITTIRGIRFIGVLLTLVLALCTDYARFVPIKNEWLRRSREKTLVALSSQDVRTLEVVCLAAYLVVFGIRLHFVRVKAGLFCGRLHRSVYHLRTIFLTGFCGIVLAYCLWGDSMTRVPTDAIVLFCGMLLGQAFVLLKATRCDSKKSDETCKDILDALIVVLALSVLLRPSWWPVEYSYRRERRWQGPWWNPDHFGLLMATGLVLAIGQAIERWRRKRIASNRWFLEAWCRWVGFYTVAAALTVVGLLKSYSRGAWFGTVVGLLYLGLHIVRTHKGAERHEARLGRRSSDLRNWILRNRVALAASLACILVLTFWNFRQTEAPVVGRVFSVTNKNDFSWRNRLVAYEGALQMMAARPWHGFGWDQTTDTFDQYFKPSRLIDTLSIQLNDYFGIGLTLGLPALVCFVGYVILSFWAYGGWPRLGQTDLDDGTQSQVIIRAGLMVLLVGFWFNRGLFFLALTTPFWVLLELGNEWRSGIDPTSGGTHECA
jgi:hypothetical protein